MNDVLDVLSLWADRGWIRRLDLAFARLIASLVPDTSPRVLLAAALVAHVEGQGHTSLALDEWLADPGPLLGWNDDASGALGALIAQYPAGLDAWVEELGRSDVVQRGDDAVEGGRPLVLAAQRLYLKRYWKYERRVADGVDARVRRRIAVDEPDAHQWLDRLFDPTPDDAIDWQKVGCALALRGGLSIVTGGPGTGKTWTAARFLALRLATHPDPSSVRIALAAPTGKAAARLRQSIALALDSLQARLPTLPDLAQRIGTARTLHGLLGARPDTRRFRFNASNPLDFDLVIVDEASMIHVEMMAALLDALPPQAQVLLLGDKDQLASVEAGAVLGDLCRDASRGLYARDTVRYVESTTGQRIPKEFVDETGPAIAQQTVMLRSGQRFGGTIGALARAVNAGDASAASRVFEEDVDDIVSRVVASSSQRVVELAVAGFRGYLDALHAGSDPRDVLRAFDRFRILCAVRGGEWGVTSLNRAIESRLAESGLIATRSDWYEGRPVIVTRNDHGLGIYNGDVGVVMRGDDRGLRAWFADGDAVRSVGVGRLADVETAFAMTVHKAQGSEFEHTVLVLPAEASRVVTRELIYTGITRARTRFTLVSANPATFAEGIAQPTRRSSGLRLSAS